MSFSSDCKTEMCKTPVRRECCARAELYGCFLLGLRFTPDEVALITGHESFPARVRGLLEFAFGRGPELRGQVGKILISVPYPSELAAAFGHDKSLRISVQLNRAVIEDECCQISFIRGVFLAGGFVSNPAKKYHLEIITPHVTLSRQIDTLLREMELPPKTTSRSGHQVLYYKDSGYIEDFLTLCGAPVCTMAIMEAKVEKDVRNNINRIVNCETANLGKTLDTSAAQCGAIRRLKASQKWDGLPEPLRQTARLRLEYPEDTLSELAERAGVGKSGVNHRLRKLMEMGDQA
ncbi:MAG: DNA-binding protein WhiA [Oscillospiraceae bacterium]|nr:DNA-binding protein WhiA [Oscillospiraceae bacterium]